MTTSDFLAESVRYYQEKLRRHGGTAEGMDWKNQQTQHLRFERLCRHIDFSARPAVLDVGCGNAEFLAYCRAQGHDLDYAGVDVVPEMAQLANERFGPGTARQAEFLEWEPGARFDYVVASGTFNAKLGADAGAWRRYLQDNLRKMFSLADRAIVFNCMSCFVDYRYDRLYYPTLQEIGEFAVRELSRRFVIDHAYPLYEMTVAVRREGP